MEIKLFYKTQRELAVGLNSLIDAYWGNEVDEETLMNQVRKMYISNPRKFMKEDKFTTVLLQQCGKRRLEVVRTILNLPATAWGAPKTVAEEGSDLCTR